MKTVEQQLDDMLPRAFKSKRRLALVRAKYFETVAANLRAIGRAGLTAEQAVKNLKANVAMIRNKDIM